MRLIAFIMWSGYHSAGWRMTDGDAVGLTPTEMAIEIAQRAEAAKLDAVFLADLLSFEDKYRGRRATVLMQEPLTTLATLAAVTKRIGLMGTASTTFTEPYNLARYFASLDNLSLGRSGWNIVTSFLGGGENFGCEMPPHDERYARAFEYMDVVTSLWESWRPGAIVDDRRGGTWLDASKVVPINFRGKYFNVAGPLNVAPPPQCWPVLVQAGASDSGKQFAAEWADVVFTVQPELDLAREFYAGFKDLVRTVGRDPAKVLVVPGVMPIIGSTEGEARALADELDELVDLDVAKATLRWQLDDMELDDLELEDRIPPERFRPIETVQGAQSRYMLYRHLAIDQGRKLRELMRFASASGHSVVVGTAEQVADTLETWFSTGACDGFNLQSPFFMRPFEAITDELIPLLQARGLFRTEYEGATLRDHLGLDQPSRASRLTPQVGVR